MRYFTFATLVAFLIVGAALIVLQRSEETFFEDAQSSQQQFFAEAQARLATEQADAARNSLLAVHEAGHVMLTRVVANILWDSDIAPFVRRAQQLPVEHCRLLPTNSQAASESNPRKACLRLVGQHIRNLPGFDSVDTKAYAAMRATRVFKIKIWDLRGIAVYSSEHEQIGDDGSANLGWQTAVAGKPASELTHRERFSAFEGVVENRDLISTYIPVRDDARDQVVGVVELYSDVTPFLEQSRLASDRFSALAANHQKEIERAGSANLDKLRSSSGRFLLIIGGLLAFLYVVSLLIVRVGQRIIDRQAAEREQAAQREGLWHQEKMAALSAMAANVAHEVGNPLAVITGLAQRMDATAEGHDEAKGDAPRLIVEQTVRIARMVRQISDFTSARSDGPEYIDVNTTLAAICEFFTYDPRFRNVSINFVPGSSLAPLRVVPDYLNEVTMNIMQACSVVLPLDRSALQVDVRAELCGHDLCIVVSCGDWILRSADWDLATDARFDQAVRRARVMGGRVSLGRNAVEIRLPYAATSS